MNQEKNYRVEYEYLLDGKPTIGFQDVFARTEGGAIKVAMQERQRKGHYYQIVSGSLTANVASNC